LPLLGKKLFAFLDSVTGVTKEKRGGKTFKGKREEGGSRTSKREEGKKNAYIFSFEVPEKRGAAKEGILPPSGGGRSKRSVLRREKKKGMWPGTETKPGKGSSARPAMGGGGASPKNRLGGKGGVGPDCFEPSGGNFYRGGGKKKLSTLKPRGGKRGRKVGGLQERGTCTCSSGQKALDNFLSFRSMWATRQRKGN